MKGWLTGTLLLVAMLSAEPICAQPQNGDFESGSFRGWIADPTWVISHDSRGYYSGWQGKSWAWSGGQGEAATGRLRSQPFTLDKEGVRVRISGWSSIHGTGQPRKWNFVRLQTSDGREIDRVWAPDTTNFVRATLDGTGYRGKTVYLEAVDDADQGAYSMLCLDDVQTVALPPPLPALALDSADTWRLEDDRYLVEVRRGNGSVARIRDKAKGLELIREPRLADSFRFTLPIPGKEPWQTIEANYLWGKDQRLSSCDASRGRLVLHWNGPLVNYLGESFDASAEVDISLVPEGVLFRLLIDNRTRYGIGEVYFPLLGGLQGLGRSSLQLEATELVLPTSQDAVTTSDIFRVFTNVSAFGNLGAEQFHSYPKEMVEPWMALRAAKLDRSVYLGVRDPAKRPKTLWLELLPGNANTVREDGNWPRPSELKGQPVGVTLSYVDFPNAPPGKTYQFPPVLLAFHDGDWHQSKKIHSQDKKK